MSFLREHFHDEPLVTGATWGTMATSVQIEGALQVAEFYQDWGRGFQYLSQS